ncbi:MAG: orotidine-5'-phosphate decarboxylase [Thermoplasmata archaeon HGW-Thermoplasmata-1]|nr:MAG: orotidine-5'-phosphate decarboxylase [Thermoplasmata archaeon HGW-Thermoplasmata-1]
MNFKCKLTAACRKNNSLVCVGLDVDRGKMPQHLFEREWKRGEYNPIFEFNRAIIDATADLVCAYKPNAAFYEALGEMGEEALRLTIAHIPKEVVAILDGKRNDIGNTAQMYAKAAFEVLGADAVTVTPYLGIDTVKPFTDYKDRGVILLCRTSNKSAGDFQDLLIGDRPFYQVVAGKVREWDAQSGNCGLVAGATYPEELARIREITGDDMPLLIPGVGAQGGDVEKTVRAGVNGKGEMAIINSSRGIIYASVGRDFAEAARRETEKLRSEINRYR